jgi:hypothetical protein
LSGDRVSPPTIVRRDRESRLQYDPAVPAERLERRPTPAQDVVSQTSERQTVLLQLESGTYFSLDGVGTLVWELCDGHRTIREIAARVCDDYDIDAPTASADVLALLTELEHARLVRFVDAAAD